MKLFHDDVITRVGSDVRIGVESYEHAKGWARRVLEKLTPHDLERALEAFKSGQEKESQKSKREMCLRCGAREQFQHYGTWCAECAYYHEVKPSREKNGIKFLSLEDFKAGNY